ncbi:MAG: ATP-binding cassette domain-containing protein, partial [Pseudomonadota bacterium]|nr:ATP-binding cassette domain-containing protein [Pseudomonadota bacterium]
MSTMLEIKGLTRQFGQFIAVNNVSFSVESGEVLGFLGPNGAGKS